MQIKTLELKKELLFDLLKFSVLVGIATLAPLIGNQMITGSIVNATLFIAVMFSGYRNALAIGLIPSLIALASGTLPIILAPMVPFIIIGNGILVLIFEFLRKKNYWLAVFSASALKFAFLAGTSSIIAGLLLKGQIAKNVSLMMSYPQLLTALAGGAIAYLFFKAVYFKK